MAFSARSWWVPLSPEQPGGTFLLAALAAAGAGGETLTFGTHLCKYGEIVQFVSLWRGSRRRVLELAMGERRGWTSPRGEPQQREGFWCPWCLAVISGTRILKGRAGNHNHFTSKWHGLLGSDQVITFQTWNEMSFLKWEFKWISRIYQQALKGLF